MPAEIPAARVRLIGRIIAAARSMARNSGDAGYAAFLQRYFSGVAEEDLLARDPQYLARAAMAHRRAAEQRAPGRAVVSVLDGELGADAAPGRHTLVAVVTADMPFLVDSLLLAFSRLGIGVHLIIHPLFDVATRRESWQLFEVDRQIDPARLELIKVTLSATLADVRAAVSDWRPMLQQAQVAARELQGAGVPHEAGAVEAQALIAWMAQDHFTFLGYRRYRLRRAQGRISCCRCPSRDSEFCAADVPVWRHPLPRCSPARCAARRVLPGRCW